MYLIFYRKMQKNINIWLSDTYGYINKKNIMKGNELYINLIYNDTNKNFITIIITGLREYYWDKRNLLDIKLKKELENIIKDNSPKFIFKNNTYILNNEITKFDKIKIPINDYIDCINKGINIKSKLLINNYNVSLDFRSYDFLQY